MEFRVLTFNRRFIPWVLTTALSCALLLPALRPAAAQTGKGHQVTAGRITVRSAEHWRNWELPVSAIDITSDGALQPHFSRDRFNLFDDLETFTRALPEYKLRRGQSGILNVDSTVTYDIKGDLITTKVKGKVVPVYSFFLRPGISRVGSNPAAAANILDGDPDTYWEPDPRDPIENWWIEVDLGRIVPVDSLVLYFADESLGDPFRQFRILTSWFQRTVAQEEDKLELALVFGTNVPNTDQRTFSIPLAQTEASPTWSGRMVETIRIIVSDTKAGRGRLLANEEQWLDIDPSERGDIVYFSQDLQGFEEPVATADDYEALPLERQGRKDYYIRERPRLAEIGAWGWGDNLSPGLVESGGSIQLSGGNFSAAPAFDADFGTNFQHLVWSPIVDRGVMTVDLGSTYWMDAIRVAVFPRAGSRYRLDGYVMRASDGDRDASGELKWRPLSPLEREDNSVDQYRYVQDSFDPPRKMRFVDAIVTSSDPSRRGAYNTGPIIGEYMLYSRGYPAEVVMHSDLIDIQGRNPGRIRWDADIPENTNIEIRTRTGSVLSKIVKYYDASGTEIPFSNWNSLFVTFKGPADTVFVPTTGWSSWSRPYVQPGDRVTSPGQRKFLQLQMRMSTVDKDVAALIRSIEIDLVDPVAGQLLAEIDPVQIQTPGQLDTFTVYVQPQFIERPVGSRSTGFDEVLFNMPASQDLELLELILGLDPSTGEPQRVFHPDGGGFVDDNGMALQVLSSDSDSIWVRLPESVNVLPVRVADRTYNRVTFESEQVPVSQDGQLLTAASYGVLPESERGAVRYFRQTVDGAGRITLTEVDNVAYADLPEPDKGPVRYFRALLGDGDQFPFDAAGDSLDALSYNGLPTDSRGSVSGPGPLVVARFRAPVFVNGTTLRMAVRDSRGGTDEDAPWQNVEAGDATSLTEANTLTIGVPLRTKLLDEFSIIPNTITPNGDGINDEAQIAFSVFKISAPREADVRIFTLSGRRVWRETQMVQRGREAITWTGVDDAGKTVAPGIYLCRLEIDADDADNSAVVTRLIAVAY
jgi:hypothetical protein